MSLSQFEKLFENKMREVCDAHPDPSHDILHVQRVVANARKLARTEGANLDVVVPAAYLHDVLYISKSDPRRKDASRLSAEAAKVFLGEISYPEAHIDPICHAIEAHSFSAGREAKSVEAKVVQDADRLDAIGAIGIARCLAFSGLALRPIYEGRDPFCAKRALDDSTNTLDHFYVKLLKLPEKMQTSAGKEEAKRRMPIMHAYLDALRSELVSLNETLSP